MSLNKFAHIRPSIFLRILHNSCCRSVQITSDTSTTFKRHFSRVPKAWFPSLRQTYNIVELGCVSPRRDLPHHVPKPNYAETGLTGEIPDHAEILDEKGIQAMRQSCALARIVLEEVGKYIKPGVGTDELDSIAHNTCLSYNAYPSPLNYRRFPKSICTSINNIACHGIPDDRRLLNGDIISVDVSVFYKGFHGDCASTFCVGDIDKKGQKLIQIALKCLLDAIKICKPNRKFCDVGKTISQVAKKHGYSVIPAFCGHGIGSNFHSPPNILHYENDDPGQMFEGMIFTIEPVICEGQPDIVILEDGWTAATEDNSRSAQFEHTILITKEGAEVLTVPHLFKKQ